MAEKRRSHPSAPLYYPGNAQVQQAAQFAGSLAIAWSQLTGVPTTRDGFGLTDVYTQSEVDALLTDFLTQTDTDALYSPLGHTHDDRYYTESEVDALLAGLDIPSTLGDLSDWPADAAGVLTNDGAGNLTWEAAGGGGTIDGSGTAGTLTKWSDSDTLTDSLLSESGTVLSAASATEFQMGSLRIFPSAMQQNVDTLPVQFCGGAGNDATHGAFFTITGNSFTATARGLVRFTAGNPGTPTGNDGTIAFQTGAEVTRWTMDRSGHFFPGANATYDLGTSSLTMRDVYIGRDLYLPGVSSGSGSATIGNTRPAAVVNSGAQGWLKLMIGGTASYIPFWR